MDIFFKKTTTTTTTFNVLCYFIPPARSGLSATYFEGVSDLGSDNRAQDPIVFAIRILQAFGEGLILILFVDNLLIMFSNLVREIIQMQRPVFS